jgi:hypothetical protein
LFTVLLRRVAGWSSILLPLLLLAAPALAAPVAPARPVSLAPTAAPASAAPASGDASASAAPPHTGYPTTREMWRYCPRDGSHQCVELDIPGVTVPDQAAGIPADPAKAAK